MPIATPATIYQKEQGLNICMHVNTFPNLEIKLISFVNPSIMPSKAMFNFVWGGKCLKCSVFGQWKKGLAQKLTITILTIKQ